MVYNWGHLFCDLAAPATCCVGEMALSSLPVNSANLRRDDRNIARSVDRTTGIPKKLRWYSGGSLIRTAMFAQAVIAVLVVVDNYLITIMCSLDLKTLYVVRFGSRLQVGMFHVTVSEMPNRLKTFTFDRVKLSFGTLGEFLYARDARVSAMKRRPRFQDLLLQHMLKISARFRFYLVCRAS